METATRAFARVEKPRTVLETPRPKNDKPDVLLRPMRKEDAESIASIHANLDVSPWNAAQWAESYEHSAKAWVITDNPTNDVELMVGYAIYRAVCEQAELLNFGVRREYQGKGLGEEFLASTLSLLPKSVEEVLLEVRRSNLPATNLYSKLGFNEATVRRDYYPVAGGGREDAIVMINTLIL